MRCSMLHIRVNWRQSCFVHALYPFVVHLHCLRHCHAWSLISSILYWQVAQQNLHLFEVRREPSLHLFEHPSLRSQGSRPVEPILSVAPTTFSQIPFVVIVLPVQVPFLRCLGRSTKRGSSRRNRGMSTGIRRAACKGEIQAQKEGRYLLYNMLHSMI